MKLRTITIDNFKGIKTFQTDFKDITTISGANGTGKTSVFDAFLWLLFGKDSTGRSEFKMRPLDSLNLPIKGLVVAVEAEIEDDTGTTYVLRKESHERIVKREKRVVGFETLCFVDEVPKSVSEFKSFIGEIIEEDKFKLLADLKRFSEGLQWKERREVLLDIAGKTSKPEGFDELIKIMKNRTVDEYKSVLTGQKKRYLQEQSEINPRIDELQKSVDDYAETDTSKLTNSREVAILEMEKIDRKRQTFLDSEQERQEAIDALNHLKSQKSIRETELQNDTSGIQVHLDKKAGIIEKLAVYEQNVVNAKTSIDNQKITMKGFDSGLLLLKQRLQPVQERYKMANQIANEKCATCGQDLPEDMRSQGQETKKKFLADLTKQGKEIMGLIKIGKAEIEKAQTELKELESTLERAKIMITDGEKYRDEVFPALDEAIKNKKTTPPEKDDKWNGIVKQITEAEKKIGKSAGEQINTLFNQRKVFEDRKAELDTQLAQSDQIVKNANRIKELEQEEKDIAQKIADVDEALDEIGRYKAAESTAVEEAVNGKFKYVKFKLFNVILNGSIEDCCEATYNGIPYSDISYGQKILVGIDIINVLSEHYKLSIPLFLDNAEHLTLPIEFEGQLIKLEVKRDQSKMVIS